MTHINSILIYYSAVVSTLVLIAGGWVKIRDYFRNKSQEKAAAIEAAVQARIRELNPTT